MLEGKVLKDFNDKENNLKKYTVGKKFKAEDKRYKELGGNGRVAKSSTFVNEIDVLLGFAEGNI